MISLLSKLKFISEASDMSVILNYLYYSGRGRGNYNYSNRSNDYRSQPFGNPGRMPDRFANSIIFEFHALLLLYLPLLYQMGRLRQHWRTNTRITDCGL